MPYITDQQTSAGLYVSTTFMMDMQQLATIDLNSPEFRDLLVRLYQNLNTIVLSLNLKDSAYYVQEEFVNGQQFFNPSTNDPLQTRSDFRIVVNFGALPNNATPKSVPHNITIATDPSTGDALYSCTRVYAAATKPTVPFSFIPIPFSSANAITDNLQLEVTNTDVVITSGGTDYSAYTICYVIFEYLKN